MLISGMEYSDRCKIVHLWEHDSVAIVRRMSHKHWHRIHRNNDFAVARLDVRGSTRGIIRGITKYATGSIVDVGGSVIGGSL